MKDIQKKKYEENFRNYTGAIGARAFGMGRHGMVILLKALGVEEGDKVGVCGYTCLSVLESIMICDAVPVYLDVDDYLCIDPAEILKQEQFSLKVVILQHTFGTCGQLDELLMACKKIGAKVIEDCAHCLDGFWDGRRLGNFGEGAIYSSEWGKPYSTGQGGMLTLQSEEMLEIVDSLIKEWALPTSKRFGFILHLQRKLYPVSILSKFKSYFAYFFAKVFKRIGHKKSLVGDKDFDFHQGYIRLIDEKTAELGIKKLARWPNLRQLRRDNTEIIEEYLEKVGLRLWPHPKKAYLTMLRYPVLVSDKAKVLKQACKNGLDISGWYTSVVHPICGEELRKVDYISGSCPKAENMIKHVVLLPIDRQLNTNKLELMMKILCNN